MRNCGLCGRSVEPHPGGGFPEFCPNCDAFLGWDSGSEDRPRARTTPEEGGSLALRVAVDPSEIAVTPGSLAHANVTVHNSGTRVEKVQLEATLDNRTQPWLTIRPADVD